MSPDTVVATLRAQSLIVDYQRNPDHRFRPIAAYNHCADYKVDLEQ